MTTKFPATFGSKAIITEKPAPLKQNAPGSKPGAGDKEDDCIIM